MAETEKCDFANIQRPQMNAQIEKSEIALGQPPTVSVIIPIFNAGRFLEDAVESVAREKYRGVKEILLVEDGSSDDSLAVARKLKTKHEDLIRLYRHPGGENRGAGASRNLGIRRATGKYICFLDADDYWLPGRLEESVSLLETDPSLDGVYSPAIYRFEIEREEKKFQHFPQLSGTTQNIVPTHLFEKAMNGEFIFCTNGFIVRKNSLENINWFDESLRRGQDTEMILRMAAQLKLNGTPSKKPVAVIRRHGNNRWNPDDHKEESEVTLSIYRKLYEWSFHADISNQYKNLIFKRYIFLLGCEEQFSCAWQMACNIRKPWYIMFAWRYRIPGPRTISLFFRKLLVRQDI